MSSTRKTLKNYSRNRIRSSSAGYEASSRYTLRFIFSSLCGRKRAGPTNDPGARNSNHGTPPSSWPCSDKTGMIYRGLVLRQGDGYSTCLLKSSRGSWAIICEKKTYLYHNRTGLVCTFKVTPFGGILKPVLFYCLFIPFLDGCALVNPGSSYPGLEESYDFSGSRFILLIFKRNFPNNKGGVIGNINLT